MSEANSNVVVPMPGSTAARIAETGVLLETPRYNGLPRHDVVYGLVRGQVGSAPLARYRLPTRLRGTHLVAPSAVDTDGIATLPALAVIADRIAPWVAVHVVPRILKKRVDGHDFQRSAGTYDVAGAPYTGAGGFAWAYGDLVLIQANSPLGNATVLFHELMHIFWRKHLSDAARGVLTDAVADGAKWPGNYFSDTEERVCRLFESWASARLEGMPQAQDHDAEELTVAWLFDFIWSGRLADHQIVRGLVPNAEALLARRGLQPLPPPAPEPLPSPPPPRRWDYVVTDWMWDVLATGVCSIGRGMRWTWREVAAAA